MNINILQTSVRIFQKKAEMDANGLDIGNISEQFWSYAYLLPDKSAGNEEAGMVYLSDVYEEMLPIGTKINIKNSDGLDCRVSTAGYIDEEDVLPAGGMAPVIYLTEKRRGYIHHNHWMSGNYHYLRRCKSVVSWYLRDCTICRISISRDSTDCCYWSDRVHMYVGSILCV